MDYEKKYRDLVEAVKELQDANPSDEGIQKWVEDNVPELKESEDERIRKALIDYHKLGLKDSPWFTQELKHQDILAWLEKQGEQKPAETIDLRTWKYIVDAVLTEREGIGQYIDSPWTTEVAEKLQKRFGNIKQKPTDKVEPKFKVGDIIRHKKQGFTCKIIAVDNEYGLSDCNGTHLPIEWQDAYELVEQNTWKPSEEQMEALAEALSLAKNCGEEWAFDIRTLYEQLKKLKD